MVGGTPGAPLKLANPMPAPPGNSGRGGGAPAPPGDAGGGLKLLAPLNPPPSTPAAAESCREWPLYGTSADAGATGKSGAKGAFPGLPGPVNQAQGSHLTRG